MDEHADPANAQSSGDDSPRLRYSLPHLDEGTFGANCDGLSMTSFGRFSKRGLSLIE
jgi:hypothetical protein